MWNVSEDFFLSTVTINGIQAVLVGSFNTENISVWFKSSGGSLYGLSFVCVCVYVYVCACTWITHHVCVYIYVSFSRDEQYQLGILDLQSGFLSCSTYIWGIKREKKDLVI